ncbi:hypothetical protein JCM10908_006545 [Rhodotorula pacifica]|uniref:uncharacterized protein n=1 Tax=Rhodotorula pacifica TaxID=1495444 RepID=UPI003180EA87
MNALPDEVLERILSYAAQQATPRSLRDFSLVSKRFASLIHLREVRLQSAMEASRFEGCVANDPAAARRVRRLFLVANGEAKDSLTVSPPAGRRGQRRITAPTSMDADLLVRLCTLLPGLQELILREIDLSALRRRQFGFAAHLSHLTSLVVSSPRMANGNPDPKRRLNLHTLGMILQDLPQLEHLGLCGVRGTSSALRGLKPPACRLVSVGLFSPSGVTGAHLQWLLMATTAADSLRTLAFDLDESVRPSQLSAVKWALLPVRHVYINSDNTRAIAVPSLRTFRTSMPFDALPELLGSFPPGRFVKVVDASPPHSGILSSDRALKYLNDSIASISTTKAATARASATGRASTHGSLPRIARRLEELQHLGRDALEGEQDSRDDESMLGDPLLPEQFRELRRVQ